MKLRKLRGKYYIRVRFNGKEKLLPTGTGNKVDAERQLSRLQKQEIEVKQKIKDEIEDLSHRLTIRDGINYFLNNVGKERNLQDSTIESYRLACDNFYDCFKKIYHFDNFTKKQNSELVSYLQAKLNPTTTNIRLRGIRAMLNYLFEKDMISVLPFKVKQIKVDKALPKFILPDEMDKIYEQIKDENLLSIFRTYEVTGMRLSEIKHSHRNGEFVIIEKSKGRKERIIPIPVVNIPDYENTKELNYSTDWISHCFSLACRTAGLKGKSLHCLRHTFALKKLVETNNIALVKELLGHSSISVTELYTRFPKQYLSQIFNDRQINKIDTRPILNA